jgi:dihydrofolate reductase
MTIGSIWAQNASGVIGLGGTIPWRYPGDFRRFKRVTMGSAVIMGRKTWESIGKPLPGRLNMVISSTPIDAAEVVWIGRHRGLHPFDVAIGVSREKGYSDIWFIGGARIYEAAMHYVDTLDVTFVPDVVPVFGAVFAPGIDLSVFETTEWVQHEDEPTLRRRVYRRIAK